MSALKRVGAEGREIENAAYSRATAPDDANAVALARLVGDRSEAGQHTDLLGGQAADLSKAGDEGGRDRKTEARDRGQDGITPGQPVVGLDALEDLAVERCEILVSSDDATLELTLEELTLGGAKLVLERGQRFDDPGASHQASSAMTCGAGARADGSIMAANEASTRASSLSVLARTPCALANIRTR